MNKKTKIGCKRTEPKRYQLKKSRIKPVSKKRQKESKEYRKTTAELIMLSGNKSELSKNHPDFRGLQNHHIGGRIGKLYLNPFNMIILTADEHDYEEAHKTQERKEYLANFIKPIRIQQGYKPEDYE